MKVILTQDVKNLGKKNQLVNVSDGYARNFLFKKNLAVEANAKNLNIMKDRKQSESSKKDRELVEANLLQSRLEGKQVKMEVRAGESGKLFGSITAKDIADAIAEQYKADIDRRKIQLDEPIKNTGDADVVIKIHPEVSINIRLVITEKV
ncbi:MAG TPA: 50S ribosomal protein L9 [Clostridia bacterium]|jgi:large subunit ribosomal protein L9|nr:50S ribosomal protein L9 [Clostridiaceae bacterium]HOF27147.1 50S ribosomal protein L9 [Clostridia bacterium]HOM34845.1 50S ribosomal protein L9 [Clostridia bacterium]HOR90022.1 50S ribosomal protein L9 [Clostridia bacterium]HOT71183.1 50S ribosomal protein L9 [Clostridia bacterium]